VTVSCTTLRDCCSYECVGAWLIMVQPTTRPHSGEEHRIEDSSGDAVHPLLDDSGIQTDTWNSVRDSHRTNSSTDDQRFLLPEDNDLEGAVGYSPNARAVPEWNSSHTERRQSYWEGYRGPTIEIRPRQRRHSSGELSGSHRSYENYLGHSRSNQFGPGERRASTQSGLQERQTSHQFGPQERRSSDQSGYEVTGRYNTWNLLEVLNPNHNHFATRYVYPPGIPRETVIVGSQLYIRFLCDEIRRLNLQPPECLDPTYANPPPLR